ncbi:Patatin-like phospholipase [Burkholderia pseudomallei]|nr:Patatin-like phospholipase [Burkholderia pseudomallei]CAJ8197764.1 Patatin-like phospholipase [Burkholderia pseudomallei]
MTGEGEVSTDTGAGAQAAVSRDDDTERNAFYEIEYEQVRRRRAEGPPVPHRTSDADTSGSPATAPLESTQGARRPHELLGLAISGGGIRSAIFSLGILQGFADAKRDILNKFDYLSTVSGGSYIGMFFAALHIPSELRNGQPKKDLSGASTHQDDPGFSAARQAAAELRPSCGKRDEALSYLRANANYLAPNGSGDYLLSSAITARNWLAVQSIVAVSATASVMAVVVLRLLYAQYVSGALESAFAPTEYVWWSPLWLVAGFAAVGQLAVQVAFWLTANAGANRPAIRELWKQGSSSARMGLLHTAVWRFTLMFLAPLCGLACAPLAFYKVFPKVARGVDIVIPVLSLHITEITLAELVAIWALVVLATWVIAFVGTAVFNWSSVQTSRARKVQNSLTNALVRVGRVNITLVLLLMVGAAAIDTIGQTVVYEFVEQRGKVVGAFAGAGSLALAGLKWALASRSRADSPMLKKLLPVVAGVAASALLVLILSFWSVAVHFGTQGWFHFDEGQVVSRSPVAAFCTRVSAVGNSPNQLGALSGIVVGGRGTKTSNGSGPATNPVLDPARLSPGYQCEWDSSARNDLKPLYWALGLLALLVVIAGSSIGLLNLSSLQSLYGARLTRCFLGASNPVRLNDPNHRDVTNLTPGDSIQLGVYYGKQVLAPVHLINATVNNTVAWNGRRILDRTTRGFGLCVGPAGIEVGKDSLRFHCRWSSDGRVTAIERVGGKWVADEAEKLRLQPVETLQVGDWCAISGAAVSTGLGYRTKGSYAFLLGVANIRLGYWWDAGSQTDLAKHCKIAKNMYGLVRLFATQLLLFQELRGMFLGPRKRRWYLTDGGHFENTGAYELIRRQLEWIIVLDNGADRDYTFDDLATLQRRIRIDFDAEMAELEKDSEEWVTSVDGWRKRLGVDLDRASIGEIASFRMNKNGDPRLGNQCSILFRVQYPRARRADGTLPHSEVLWIKPRIPDTAPYDVREYAVDSDFPQESTMDQFFDEAQWESHRKLGEWLVGLLMP